MFGLPETKDETSPDNIEDGEVFGKVIFWPFNRNWQTSVYGMEYLT